MLPGRAAMKRLIKNGAGRASRAAPETTT